MYGRHWVGALRHIALGRRLWPFADSDRGGQRAAALIYTLIATTKLWDVDPQAWLADVLARIADHPASRLDALLPWHWKATQDHRAKPSPLDHRPAVFGRCLRRTGSHRCRIGDRAFRQMGGGSNGRLSNLWSRSNEWPNGGYRESLPLIGRPGNAQNCPIADSLSVQQTRTDASHIRPFSTRKAPCVLLEHAHRADVRDGTVADAGDAELGQSVI